MNFRIIKEHSLSYRAEVSNDNEDWLFLGIHYTKIGAKVECRRFMRFYKKREKQLQKSTKQDQLVDSFSIK